MKQFVSLVIFLEICFVAKADYTAQFDNLETIELSRQKRGVDFSLGQAPVIRSLTITTNIVARFSDTEVKSEIENMDLFSQAVTFRTQLPKTAFISNFSLVIEGVEYVGKVLKKAEATARFQQAQAIGLSAGLVQNTQRDTHWFEVTVNVESFNIVTFKLRYQQLLSRRLGEYEQILFIDPNNNVEQVNVDVYVTEPGGLKVLESPDPFIGTTDTSPQDTEFLKDVSKSSVQGRVSFWKFNFEVPSSGFGGRRFVIKYQLERQKEAGEVFVHNGYFVHFYAPTLPVLPKRLWLVVDTSYSMKGIKMEQTKTALISLLDQLNKADSFGIVTFGNRASFWRTGLTSAFNKADVAAAKTYIRGLVPSGATNMFGGIVTALSLLATAEAKETEVIDGTSALVLLTDGKPTRGLTSQTSFRRYLKHPRFNPKLYPIFCLGFGTGADHKFLEEIATEHKAVSRKIYESFDADKQIEGFFKEIANPILSKISMEYVGNVNNLTQTTFDVIYEGSEITVMGTTDMSNGPDTDPIEVNVIAFGFGGDVNVNGFGETLNSAYDYPVAENIEFKFNVFFERMWAYLTLQQLLKKEAVETNFDIRIEIEKEIVKTALKYNFVTPFTSLFAEKPDDSGENIELVERNPQIEEQQVVAASFDYQAFHVAEPFIPPPAPKRESPPPVKPQAFKPNFVLKPGSGFFPVIMEMTMTMAPFTTTRKTTTPTTTTPTTTTLPTTVSTSRLPPPPTDPDTIVADSGCGFSAAVQANRPMTIESPGYLYERNVTCKWVISDQMNRDMKLNFERFDLEYNLSCNRDRVLLYIDRQTYPVQLCGSIKSTRVFSSVEKITVVFQTNNVVQGTGFKAVFKVADYSSF